MSIIMTVVTSRGNEEFTMCLYQCPIIELVSALILMVLIFFILPRAC